MKMIFIIVVVCCVLFHNSAYGYKAQLMSFSDIVKRKQYSSKAILRSSSAEGRGEWDDWNTSAYLEDEDDTVDNDNGMDLETNLRTSILGSFLPPILNATASRYSVNIHGEILDDSSNSGATSINSVGSIEADTWDENPPYFDEYEIMLDDDYKGSFQHDPPRENIPISSDLNAKHLNEWQSGSDKFITDYNKVSASADNNKKIELSVKETEAGGIISFSKLNQKIDKMINRITFFGTIMVLLQIVNMLIMYIWW